MQDDWIKILGNVLGDAKSLHENIKDTIPHLEQLKHQSKGTPKEVTERLNIEMERANKALNELKKTQREVKNMNL